MAAETAPQPQQASTPSSSGLGPLIRLRALKPSQLPNHPSLTSQHEGAEARDIQQFAASALEEANVFMTTYLHTNFSLKSSGKSSPPSKAPVELFAKDIPASQLPKGPGGADGTTESWFARKSIHENKSADGTASWEEFDHGLRTDHSQHEMAYTPGVIDAHEVMNWREQLATSAHKVDGGWEDVQASVMEMVHKIPAPLNNRVFPVLIITAKKADSLLVVQIPVATQGLPGAKYHNVPKVTGGMYCSIERCELMDGGEKVQWQMATASDAKGNLPMWAQKMGVPGAVVKDVGLFIHWVAERRAKGKV